MACSLSARSLLAGLQTEKLERKYIAGRVPQTPPIPRTLGTPQQVVDAEGFEAIHPRERPRDRVAYDLNLDDLIARLMARGGDGGVRGGMHDVLRPRHVFGARWWLLVGL